MDEMHLRYIWGHYTDPQNAGIELQAFDARYDCEAWRVYGYQWTATEMVWSIDGVEVGRLTSGIDVPEVDWPNEELSLVMNNAVMDADLPDETNAWPNFLTVDHLALYEHTGS
jgi:beta-glucanase (GH16 family)